jgi:hypothetical protein
MLITREQFGMPLLILEWLGITIETRMFCELPSSVREKSHQSAIQDAFIDSMGLIMLTIRVQMCLHNRHFSIPTIDHIVIN